ncbi:hypothetical protein Tco_1413104 [Tanacetum coccineum]
MKGKPNNLPEIDKPKVLQNPSSILNSRQHHVASQPPVYGQFCDLDSVFQRSRLSLDIEEPVTFEPNSQITLFSLCCNPPSEGVLSHVPGSTSREFKRKSRTDDASDAFDKYSQLCARNDLERALLKLRHLQDDRYGCLFQQSECVETQGESSGAGLETCVIAHNVNADENENSQGFLLTPTCTIGFRTAGIL